MKNPSLKNKSLVNPKLGFPIIAFVTALLLAGAGAVFGQTSLFITNNSFEIPAQTTQHIYISGTAGTSGYMSGWTTVATEAGYWSTRNTNASLSGVTNVDAAQIVEAYNTGGGAAGYIYQELTNNWVAGVTYTLTARAGQPSGGNPPNTGDTFSIDAISGGTLTQLSSTTISNSTNGLLNYTVSYTATGSEPGNGHIVVAFHVPHQTSVGGMWIDNFALTASAAPDPSFTTQPASQAVSPGQSAVFSVALGGTAPFSYQWQATNAAAANSFTNLVNGGQITGSQSNVLTIANASILNALAYRVIATNGLSTSITSSVANLSVFSSLLVNGDIGPGALQTGAAILGAAGDTWNALNPGTANTVVNSGNSTLSGVSVTVDPGSTPFNSANPTVDAATASLMKDFVYRGPGGAAVPVSINGLGSYIGNPFTLVVYAGMDPNQPCTNNITAGATGGNTSSSLFTTSATRKLSDGIGVAYNTFTGTLTNGTLTFAVSGASYHGPNGFQLQIQLPNPGIATQPVSRTNVVGTTATFNVVGSGNTPFGYQWQAAPVGSGGPYTNVLNTGGISGATSNILTLPNLATSQALDYVVIVTNDYGSITSSPATLTVLTIPIITTNPVSQTVLSGSTVSYTVGATGVGTLSYQWQATNSAGGGYTNIVNATNTFLTLSGVTSNSATSYQVVVSNLNGAVTSVPASLTVLPITSLVNVQFYALTNGFNGPGANQSGAAVLGSPGDVWGTYAHPYYDFTGIPFNAVGLTNTAGAANGMTMTVTQPGNAVYTAFYTGTNVDAGSSNLMTGMLELFNNAVYPGYIDFSISGLSLYTNSPFELVVYAGKNNALTQTITLTNGATGGNTASALTTSSTSRQLSAGPGVAYNTFVGTITNGTLNFRVTGGVQNGNMGVNGFQLLLSPSVPPIITSNPASQTNVVGSTVQFSVVAAGAGALTYQWQTNGVNVGNGGVFSGTTSNVLTLTNINTNNSLAYQVVVSSGAYSVTSSPATLTVLTIPIITTQPVSQSALAGTPVSFNVVATGLGTLTYQWQATNSAGGGFTNVANATNSVLNFASVTANQALTYQVVVANLNGSVTSSPVLLTVDSATRLINVDIGTAAGKQSGAAVLGAAGDVWNGIIAGGSFSPVVDASSNVVTGVAVVPQAGLYSYNYNGTGGSAVDAGTTNLMNDFMFPYPNVAPGPFTVILTNLTEYNNSPFALVVYSAMGANQGATINLAGAVGGNSTNTLATTGHTKQLSLGIGNAYQIFTGTVTNSALTITFTANPGSDNFHGCNGLQLLLTPVLPPIIVNPPLSQAASVGSPVTFSVGVLGSAPFSYQWQAGTGGTYTNIPGATTNVLTLPSVTTAQGLVTYQVIVSNSQAVVTSTPPATLTVLPPPSLVGQWLTNQASGFADLSGFQPTGTHDGYTVGTLDTSSWQVGDKPANHSGDSYYMDGSLAIAISNTVSSDANYKATFDTLLANKMTIAFWAKYGAAAAGAPFVAKNGVSSAGWEFRNDTGTANAAFSVVGTGIANSDLPSTNQFTDVLWHHYVGTWDGTTGNRSVYVDGVLITNRTSDLSPMTLAGANRLVLGAVDTAGTGDAGIGNFFATQLYDVRVYNYAISGALVTSLFTGNAVVNSTNAYLNSLVLNPAGTLSPSFASTTFGYTATEAYGNSPTVTVVPADAAATVQLIYNGTTNVLTSGTPSAPLALTLGSPNVVTVKVTAQDAVTVQTYTVNVTEQPSLTLPKLTNSVVGSVFNLSWPADHLGYRLLVQTNNLAKGVSGNTNDWATVVGSTAVTATNFPVVTTNKNSYYRLVYP